MLFEASMILWFSSFYDSPHWLSKYQFLFEAQKDISDMLNHMLFAAGELF